jgi:hypothetical protein
MNTETTGTQTDGKPKPNVIVINNEVKQSKKRKERKVAIPTIAEYQPTKSQRWRIYQKRVKPKLDKIISENLSENDLTKKIKNAFEEFKVDEVNKVKDVATSGNYFGDNLFNYNQQDLTKMNTEQNRRVIRNIDFGGGTADLLQNEFGDTGAGIGRLLRRRQPKPSTSGIDIENILGNPNAPAFVGTRFKDNQSVASTEVNTSLDFIDNLMTPISKKRPIASFSFSPEITPSPAQSRATPTPTPSPALSRLNPEIKIKRAVALETGIVQRKLEGRTPQKISEKLQNARFKKTQSAKK